MSVACSLFVGRCVLFDVWCVIFAVRRCCCCSLVVVCCAACVGWLMYARCSSFVVRCALRVACGVLSVGLSVVCLLRVVCCALLV